MPIIVKDFSIQDEEDKIYISVPLRNVHPSKVVIYSNSVYIKANYPPYFFELDLAGQVDHMASSVSIGGNGLILFEMVKTEPGLWNDGHAYVGQDRLVRRAKGEQEDLNLQAQLKQKKLLEKREKERELVRAQIAVEREARETIQALKEKEIQTAKEHIAAWTKDMKDKEELAAKLSVDGGSMSGKKIDSAIFDTGSSIREIVDDDDLDSFSTMPKQSLSEKVDGKEEDEESDEESDEDIDLDAIRNSVKKQLQGPQHAPPRRSATAKIHVKFTGRGNIPTMTARESEDAKWMTRIKLAKAMNALKGGEDSKAGIEATQKGQAAREKGSTFFKLGNFEGALNAFSEALEYDSQDINALSNRAACFLKLDQPEKCIQDCNRGLETLSREEEIIKNEIKKDDGCGEQRRKQKLKLFVRRGTGFANLAASNHTDINLAVKDYEAALMLDPENDNLRADLEGLKQRVPETVA